MEAHAHATLVDTTVGDISGQALAPAVLDERPTICVLALSPIADDPRVRRQAEAFHRAGWNVIAVGLPGARSAEPEWRVLTRDDLPAPSVVDAPADSSAAMLPGSAPSGRHAPLREMYGLKDRLPCGLRRLLTFPIRLTRNALVYCYYRTRQLLNGRIRYALRLLGVRVRPVFAQDIYWSFSENIQHIYSVARQEAAAVWLANDWTMLPLAARLARERGGVYGYDTHEFAAEEYGDQRKWRLWHRPMVCALEQEFICGAAVVSAVSSKIAERLQTLYRLPNPGITIRNTPPFEAVSFRPTAHDRVKVLYHGIVTPGRGLEATIDSVAAWRPAFELTIRGPGDEGYLDGLRRRIAERGLAERIIIAPPVPMTALVREAAAYDVGFFALPGSSRHNEFALPNKFFEYLMAGLALCVTDLPEMARLLREHDLGVTFPRVDPEMIAAAINDLHPAAIDRYKRNALRAARELCWERESERLVAAYGAALARPKPEAA
ncbi:MAG: glycosyltransferase [Stellaceae bacterium]